MRSFLTATIGTAAVLGLCVAVQGCGGGSSTQAGSGSQATADSQSSPGAAATSGSPAASGAPTPSTGGGSSATGTSSAKANSQPKVSHSPVVALTGSAQPGAPSGSFTVPAVTSAVQGWGSYSKVNSHMVHVQVCAKRLGNVDAVGVEAIAYNSDYSEHGVIASVIMQQTPGQQACTQINLLYTGHLKVFSFIGTGGTISQKSAMKTIY
jgi:hypothetical protein